MEGVYYFKLIASDYLFWIILENCHDVVGTGISLERRICLEPSFDFRASQVNLVVTTLAEDWVNANTFATNTSWSFYGIWLYWRMVFAAYKLCDIEIDPRQKSASILSFQIVSFFFKSCHVSAIIIRSSA